MLQYLNCVLEKNKISFCKGTKAKIISNNLFHDSTFILVLLTVHSFSFLSILIKYRVKGGIVCRTAVVL